MSDIYDLTEIREMSGNDQDFIKELIQLFVKNNIEYLQEINLANEQKDWAQVKFFAHKIKPSILVIHADILKQPILDLNEYAGKQINLEMIPELLDLLNEQLPNICASLENEIK